MPLAIIMFLLLIASYAMLAGLVRFSESVIRR
jgi:hypothetical protein